MSQPTALRLALSGHRAPVDYDRAPTYSGMIAEKDVLVPMRDGVKIAIDIYRPETTDRLPALLAFSIHNKDLQGPEPAQASLTHPAWSMLWTGPAEAGDTRFFVSRGYVHVIGNPRGIGKSESGGSRAFDSYDLIEWVAAQPWCDGNVGMVGISGFGAEQFMAAKLNPPHLKATFPFDPRGAYGEAGGFRDEYPGGVIHLFRFLLQVYAAAHQQKGQPKPLPPEREKLWQEAIANPDFKMYPHVYNVLALKGQHFPVFFDILIDPYDKEAAVEKSDAEFSKIDIPTYTGSGWYGYTYKTHLNGAQNWFRNLKTAHKKLLLAGPAHLDRPVKAFHDEMLRWYDQWLKGIDTGILNEPPVRFWVMGANEWRSASDWPPPQTQWIKFYLRGWERLTTEPFVPSSADDYQAPDAFVQMPASLTNRIQKLRYLSDPLAEDVTIAGPSVLHLYAAIDQDDTNWIVILKDIGPDVGVQTAREGERDISRLHERELTRGWLKASHRAIDAKRSLPGRPWHPLTRAARKPVAPDEINEYAIEIMATANEFKRGHRICVEIASLDVATGVGGATNVEYIPYHICSSKTVLHKIYHDPKYPSHLLLPVISIA
ncbi:MAG TPA: CocE/NonD family hydrolase [Xanthobacteraceae bacterium]|jgi:predicted acyl esterase|nr:CocE/NonD family hydrolase [Xanthobacteraceae bacterium]